MKIALGSAQFGLNYGISNTNGKVPEDEVRTILALAKKNNVQTIDTAFAYGDSEAILGSTAGDDPYFKIVTKTRPLKGLEVPDVVRSFEESLAHLKRSRVYGLLVHEASDLMGTQSKLLYSALLRLKQEGKIEKLGVSVYDSSQIDSVLQNFPIDMIQVPFNVLDQRLVQSGHLAKLKNRNIEIHARSIFLQGLLLMPLDQVPAHLNAAIPVLTRYKSQLAARGLSPLEGALMGAFCQPELDFGVLGVCSARELGDILAAQQRVKSLPTNLIDFSAFRVDQVEILNPALWAPKRP